MKIHHLGSAVPLALLPIAKFLPLRYHQKCTWVRVSSFPGTTTWRRKINSRHQHRAVKVRLASSRKTASAARNLIAGNKDRRSLLSTMSRHDYFASLFGFAESSYNETQERLLGLATFQNESVPGYARERCTFRLEDGREVSAGIFSLPSVQELRTRVKELLSSRDEPATEGTVRLQNIVGEARALHQDSSIVTSKELGAVVQAASQFNMLEFPSQAVIPEAGITNYHWDHTQGPACAMACAAGTAYRNYLVPVPFFLGDRPNRGQTRDNQINSLEDVEEYLMEHLNLDVPPWKVKNGYIESSQERLSPVNQALTGGDTALADELIKLVRIGVQEDTAITDVESFENRVTQTYNSAISIGYSMLPDTVWAPVARVVLNATYEATVLVGLIKIIEADHRGLPRPPILLTMVGGGVFRNKNSWIRNAIQRALEQVKQYGIDFEVNLVHFREVEKSYLKLEKGSKRNNHGEL